MRGTESYATRVSGRTDLEIAAAFVSHVRGTPADDAELAVLGAAFEGVRRARHEGQGIGVPA